MADGLPSPLQRPLTPAEQGALLCAGVQWPLQVPELKKIPTTISSIKPKTEYQRAKNAWNAACRLDAVLTLWSKFLGLVLIRARLDAPSEERLCPSEQRKCPFPGLQDLGGVLNALAAQVTWEPDVAPLLPHFDARVKIVREPTERHRGEDVRPFLGRLLQGLIEGFRKLLRTDAHCLHLLGVNVPTFRRPAAEIASDIAKVTCVDLDFTGEAERIDAAKTLKSDVFREACGRLRRGACDLMQQLENYPEAVLARQEQSSTSSPKRTRSKPGMTLKEANVKVRDYLTANPKATREQVAKALGCSAGQVSRTEAWKKEAERRGKRKPALKKTGLAIAEEKKATAAYEERMRKERCELSEDEGGAESSDDDFSVEDRKLLEAMNDDARAEFHQLKKEQEKEARADRRRQK